MDEKAKDKRLQRLYGITLGERTAMDESHSGKCWGCGRPPVSRALAVDHDHRIPRTKIVTTREPNGWWTAEARLGAVRVSKSHTRRNAAIRCVRQGLKKLSVRGLLCFQCNSGLRKFSDDPDRLESAARYLRAHRAKFEVPDAT